MTKARLRIEKVMIASIMGFDCGTGIGARATSISGLELRQVFGRVSLERIFAAVAAQEDDLAGDDDSSRRPHRAERLVRHGASFWRSASRAILGCKLLELGARKQPSWSRWRADQAAAARSPRPAPK